MPVHPERVKLESELFDLDQQLGSINQSTRFSNAEKVLRKGYLQHQRQKTYLQLAILQQKSAIEQLERDLELARINYAQTRTAEGIRARLNRDKRRQRGMAFNGGTNKRSSAFERLTPEERVIKTAKDTLSRAEYDLLVAQHGLWEKETHLRELEATDSKWKMLIGPRKDDALRAPVPQSSAQTSALQIITWDNIKIIFLSDERVQIHNGKASETRNFAEFGFVDRRSGKPNQAWITLRALAEEGGTIRDSAKTGQAWPKIEKRIQDIRKVLREQFGIAGDPLPYVQSVGYRARFKVACGPSYNS
jgi:hypothetical protein